MTKIIQQSLHRKMFRGGALLFAGKGVNQACSFLRNIIVARLIGVENFGVAATFSITISILDMIGSLSVDKMLIQATDGDVRNLQSTAHAIQGIRGIFSCLIILAGAAPLAQLFGVPSATWAFRYLALIPFLRGIAHLDPQRVQRHMNYRPTFRLDIAQQVIPTLFAWPLCVWLRDYSAMLWLLVIQGMVTCVGSHMLAQDRYRWAWDSQYTKRFLRFGWPLVLNALLLIGVYQGDRFLIGGAGRIFGVNSYSLADLGVYSVALLLTMTPMVALSQISSSLMLPLFSSLQGMPNDLQRKYKASSQLISLLTGCFALPFILAGGWLVTAVYGGEYTAAGTFIGWLAAGQALRLARSTPTAAAMAFADTTNALFSNLVRTAGLAVAAGVIASGGSLKWVAAAGFAGEFFGLIFSFWRLEKDHRIPMSIGIQSMVPSWVAIGLAGLIMFVFPQQIFVVKLGLLVALPSLFCGTMLFFFSDLRRMINIQNMFSRFRFSSA